MGYLVSNGINGVVSYKGTQYVNPDKGTHRLCLRTGLGSGDVVKYGLTSNSSASQYCGMKMRIDENVAYIGRSEYDGDSEANVYYNSSIKESGGEYSYQTLSSTTKYTNTWKTSSSGTRTSINSSKIVNLIVTNNSSIVQVNYSITSGTYTWKKTQSISNNSAYSSISTMVKYITEENIYGTDNPNKALSKSMSSFSTRYSENSRTHSYKNYTSYISTYYTTSSTTSKHYVPTFQTSENGKDNWVTCIYNKSFISEYRTISLSGSTSRQTTRTIQDQFWSSYSLTMKDAQKELINNFNL